MFAQMHLPTFYAWSRRAPFGGRLSQAQVDGIEGILKAWRKHGDRDKRKLAYILATAFHETGGKMVPVREGFGKNDAASRHIIRKRKYAAVDPITGHVYYGRGQVQLTWAENYKRMGEILGIKLYENPDLALDPEIGAVILVEGMTRGASGRGDFTGKCLADYFHGEHADPIGARRIVNGTDKDQLIAGYYHSFLSAIEAAEAAQRGEREREEIEQQSVNPFSDLTSIGSGVAAVGGVTGSVISMTEGIDDIYSLAAFLVIGIGVYLVMSGRFKLKHETGE